MLYVHLTLVPYIKAAGELKTKPTQHSVRALRDIGIQPDILICRTERPLTDDLKKKIALFCNVENSAVIDARDVPSIYEVPLRFHADGLDDIVLKKLGLDVGPADLPRWSRGRPHSEPVARGDDRHLRQVRRPQGRVQEHHRGVRARRRRERREGRPDVGRRREDRADRRRGGSARGVRRRAGSGRVRRTWHRGQDRLRSVRARAGGCRTSGYASACTAR